MGKKVLLAEGEKIFRKMKEGYPDTPDQLIPLLQFVQEEIGYLSVEGMHEIARYLKVPSSHVYGVATFYTQFRFKPLGKNRITICRGTACHVRGSPKVIDEVTNTLGIRDGETTKDLGFSFETVACVGSCALAPVVVVNKKVHGKVTSKRMKEVIDELRGIEPGKKEKEKPAEPAPEKTTKKAAAKKAAQKKSAKKAANKKTGKKPAARKAAKKAKKATGKKAVKKTKKASAKKRK